MILDDGSELGFGQSLEEIDTLFKVSATENPLPIARKGTDKPLTHGKVTPDFDSGRLMRIPFDFSTGGVILSSI
jgi:hypothetical protein